ncbi:MAG: TRAP transporter small permease subunit, partial [Undibacterium sp.]|nr:TRAP transporter small permease subunit [Undibacterium sp.]
MRFLLSLSKLIDTLNEFIGKYISIALLLAVLICTGQALLSYFFKLGDISWSEIQWYLFSAVFLLSAPATLRRNEHVRIDVVTSRFSKRTQVWIDIFGFLFFLLSFCFLIFRLGLSYALEAIYSQEKISTGLVAWPARLLIPVSFFLLSLQGFSEIIKRVGYLRGLVPASEFDKHALTPEEEIALHLEAMNIKNA